MSVKPKILVFVDYYVPGYKAGGPIRAIQNLVDNLHKNVDFFILTRCHDQGEGDYADIEQNIWVDVGRARIQYLSQGWTRFVSMVRQLRNRDFQRVYLNSFFSFGFSVVPMLANRFLGSRLAVTLAPRGEFCAGALQIKPFKKGVFIKIMRLTGLYDDITWQASTETEVEEIHQLFPAARCQVARELAPVISPQPLTIIEKGAGELSIVFISRISRKKNLDLAIRLLSNIKKGLIRFDIFGPIEDQGYWEKCLDEIERVGDNITVTYCGDLEHSQVAAALSQRHLFFLPTLGENFGYAILEAFFSGRPVLISDATPWRELEKAHIGFDLALSDEAGFTHALEYFVGLDQAEYDEVVACVESYVRRYLADFADQIASSERLFLP